MENIIAYGYIVTDSSDPDFVRCLGNVDLLDFAYERIGELMDDDFEVLETNGSFIDCRDDEDAEYEYEVPSVEDAIEIIETDGYDVQKIELTFDKTGLK